MSHYDLTTRKHRGHTITISFDRDDDMGPPWKEHDCHGIVSEPVRRNKKAGERRIYSHGIASRYYDIEATTENARREGWGISDEENAKLTKRLGRPPTRGEIVAAAVESDFQHLKAWCDNKWEWVTRRIEITGLDYDHEYLSGIEGTDLSPYIEEGISEAIDFIDREIDAREDAAYRDIPTFDGGFRLIPAIC